jgi:hypothetical protein
VRWKLVLIPCIALIIYAQKPFREYDGTEYNNFPLPKDYRQPSEWVFARLMYPSGGYGRYYGDWHRGGTAWTIDYPRSDRHIASAVRRLTRIDARSVEQPVNLDDVDDVFNWPYLYGVEVGRWELTDAQAKQMREYLLRGGFFMCDDFHGTRQWDVFVASMSRVFPDRPIVELDDKDPIFHTIFDLDDRYQVPGEHVIENGITYEYGGTVPRWRGIYDDKGRLMVAICHNMDLGDSWEHADNPRYPEKYSALGLRIGVNYIVYSMSH